MNHIVQLARGALPLLALAFAAGACDSVDPTELLTNDDGVEAAAAAPVALSFSSAFRGGIPFGTFHLPIEQYGTTYNGSLGNIYPAYLLTYLETARRTGARLMLSLPSSENNFVDKRGEFSLDMWKKQVDRFRGLDLSSYVADGTIIGHYMIDEPHDPANWNGKTVPVKTLDEMARYSKQLWPTMPTIVRAWPAYLKGYDYKYLDAAWAQYSERFGSATEFIRNNVRDAKASGLALVVGMNQLAGGSKKGPSGFVPGKHAMAADELEEWGSTLLADSYPCAFINWKYDAKYMQRSDVKSAMANLSQKARNHASSSCRAAGSVAPAPAPEPAPVPEPVPAPVPEPAPAPVPEPVPAPVPEPAPAPVPEPAPAPVPEPAPAPVPEPAPAPVPEPAPAPVPEPAPAPAPAPSTQPGASIKLSVTGRAETKAHRLTLTWSGATGRSVDVYRNGPRINVTENDRRYVNLRSFKGAAAPTTYVYKVCESGTSRCSNTVSLTVR